MDIEDDEYEPMEDEPSPKKKNASKTEKTVSIIELSNDM